MSKDKRILWTVIAVVIAIMSIIAVRANSGGVTFEETMELLRNASPLWMAMAVLCMLGYIVFEAMSLKFLLAGAGYRRPLIKNILYSAGDVYFSAITPSASGGQPATAVLMVMDKIPGAVVTVILIANLVLYTSAIVVIGIFCLIVRARVFMHFSLFSKILIIGSLIVLMVLTVLLYGLLRRGSILKNMGHRLIAFLTKIHLMHHPEKWQARLDKMVGDYQKCADLLAGKKSVIWSAFFCNLLQRASQITVSLMVFYALRGHEARSLSLWAVQAFAQVGSNVVPIPGGMGLADYLMLDGFAGMFPREYAFQLGIISRALSFYTCAILCAVIAMIGYLLLRRHGAETAEEAMEEVKQASMPAEEQNDRDL
ncbi:MAG: flippase-like domain-containing protein [Lachnospiraceae bacterium]|nr:flippase-like domain-containing protein [Lachnospiraceae bacterium]